MPVGAGGFVVRHTSWWWELAEARRAHRPARPLFHAVLEVAVDDTRHVIEMAPTWGVPAVPDRGVVVSGPVGLRFLGFTRLFRYEVRCWRDGDIPDRAWAPAPPTTVSVDAAAARTILNRVKTVPALTWGRGIPSVSDMWNSNSLVAWLLATARISTTGLCPPEDGRAPGWRAGLAVAAEPGLASSASRRQAP